MVGLIAAPALAWEVKTTPTGDPVRWQGFPVSWDRAADATSLPDRSEEAIRAAFETWSRPGTAVEFALGGSPATPARDASPDDGNHVWVVAPWPLEDEALARASLWFDPGGNLVAFDVRVNGEKPWSLDGEPDTFDLQSAVVHEVGHALGLEHADLADAVMFPSLDADDQRRELSDDDDEALAWLYPATAEDPPASCAVLPLETSLAGIGGALVALLRRGAPLRRSPC